MAENTAAFLKNGSRDSCRGQFGSKIFRENAKIRTRQFCCLRITQKRPSCAVRRAAVIKCEKVCVIKREEVCCHKKSKPTAQA